MTTIGGQTFQFTFRELATAFEAMARFESNVAAFVRRGEPVNRAMALASIIAYPALEPIAERIGAPYSEPDMAHSRRIVGAVAAGDRVLERFDPLINAVAETFDTGDLPTKARVFDFPSAKREAAAAEPDTTISPDAPTAS